MNEYDNLTISGTVSMHPVTSAISKLEKDVIQLQADTLTMRAQLAQEMMMNQVLRGYIEYLNPADAPRPAKPMSYADWLKLQVVSDQIVAAA